MSSLNSIFGEFSKRTSVSRRERLKPKTKKMKKTTKRAVHRSQPAKPAVCTAKRSAKAKPAPKLTRSAFRAQLASLHRQAADLQAQVDAQHNLEIQRRAHALALAIEQHRRDRDHIIASLVIGGWPVEWGEHLHSANTPPYRVAAELLLAMRRLQ